MISFQLSAFLKLLSLTENQQVRELRKRLRPGGLDYYLPMKQAIHRHLYEGESLSKASECITRLKQESRKRNNFSGLHSFEDWRARALGRVSSLPQFQTFKSPRNQFTVRLAPELALTMNDRVCVIALWNTKKPILTAYVAQIGVTLLKRQLRTVDSNLELNILDLRLGRLHVPNSEVLNPGLFAQVEHIENLWMEINPSPEIPDLDSIDRPRSPEPPI